MPQFRVLRRSDKERIYTDKINPREHLHITGVEFTDSMIRDLNEQYGSNTFKISEASKPAPVIEKTSEVVEEKKEHWKVKEKREKAEALARGETV